MTDCDCLHAQDMHDSVTGACYAINMYVGPCSCAATPESARSAMQAVFKSYLQPEYQKLRRAVREIRRSAGQDYNELLGLFNRLLDGTDDEQAEIRRQMAMLDRLLDSEPAR